MRFTEADIEGVWFVDPSPLGDDRGYFMRTYDDQVFAEHGLRRPWVQENESLSARPHTVRGIHFQFPPHAETKLVRVVTGAVFDVFVDLRKGSATFGRWGSTVLSGSNKRTLFLPKGIGHAVCTLEPDTRMLYKHDDYYAPESESNIRWDDPDIAIEWPLRPDELARVATSDRDSAAPSLREFVKRHGGIET